MQLVNSCPIESASHPFEQRRLQTALSFDRVQQGALDHCKSGTEQGHEPDDAGGDLADHPHSANPLCNLGND